MHTITNVCRHALAAAAVLIASAASAQSVQYTVTNLTDTTVGEDLWQYDYTLGGPLGLFESFNVFFAADQARSLTLAGNSTTFDVQLTQPDAGFGADGIAGFLSMNDNGPLIPGKVSVSFVWLGTGTPGAQAFAALDATVELGLITRGTTTPLPAIPEPGTSALLALGLGALAFTARRRAATAR